MEQKAKNLATYVREWVKANPKTLVIIGVLLLGLVMLTYCNHAQAQTPPAWNEARITWTAPTQFTDGSPIPAGTVITYQLQRRLGTGTWAAVGPASITALTFLDTGLTAGEWCYRAAATVGGRQSVWSNEACKTVTQPAPNPPAIQVVDSRAFDVRFNFRRLEFVVGRQVGEVPVGTRCYDDFVVDGAYYRVKRQDVELERRARSAVLVARCGLA